ncbi:GntR family transcriptional regulator [Vaginisenegalia massiliensis]|uniref:GntR family transcriptional regulator n=1 Tax=Vaginisenegalia massiliensis TaxID=2058294 RepID=UPI000F52BC6C|nr:GntR family transcriptional regulator [Vaginisenegalia massiliensis]
MKIILKNGQSVPLYEQIKEAIKGNIMEGRLEDGEMLPSVRTMSKELKVSILTVKKAYDELAEEGFIEVRQGLGTFVAENNSLLRQEEKQKQMETKLIEAIQLGHEIQLDKESFMTLVQYLYEGESNGK